MSTPPRPRPPTARVPDLFQNGFEGADSGNLGTLACHPGAQQRPQILEGRLGVQRLKGLAQNSHVVTAGHLLANPASQPDLKTMNGQQCTTHMHT